MAKGIDHALNEDDKVTMGLSDKNIREKNFS